MPEFRPNRKRSARFEARSEHELHRSRELRRAMTPPEIKLWVRLRDRRLGGLKFRRQHIISPYFSDFYCDEAGLVVELDGRSHAERAQEDARRDGFVRKKGIRTLRISVSDFERDIEGALALILRTANARVEETGKGK